METSFPVRDNILKLLNRFFFFSLVLFGIGCGSKKEYNIAPVPVFTKTIKIDSIYTKVKAIPTGDSYYLFCGNKGPFDSYSIMKFDSIPDSFDSLFIKFASDSGGALITFYKVKEKWDEDSIYLWSDVGRLIDTLHPLKTVAINDTNPLIFLGDSLSLRDSIINAINNFGLAVHSDSFYLFGLVGTVLKTKNASGDFLFYLKDGIYIIKNPFQDTIFKDSLLVGRGLSIQTHLFFPRDSLPNHLNKVAEAKLSFKVKDKIPFGVEARIMKMGYIFYPIYSSEKDTMSFDLAPFFKDVPVFDTFHIVVKAQGELGGIGVEKLEGGEIKFVWVEFPK
ncbi:MAG: hypothetical protein ABIN61_07020 [candidate division WOR-3 bacterium]